MIIRNFHQDEVQKGLYKAHEGADAAMLFTNRELQGMLFLAHAELKPGKKIEAHIDPYEEIYYILQGQGLMQVDQEKREVGPGDAVWIPCGSVHSLENTSEGTLCQVLVVAALPHTGR